MSYGRYPPYGPPPARYPPPGAYYGPPRLRPGPQPPSARPGQDALATWPTPGYPHPGHPDDHHTPFGTHPGSEYPEDELGLLSSAQPTPWATLPRDFQLDDPSWGHAAARSGAYPPGSWYAYPPGPDQLAARRPYAQLDHFGHNLDQRQARLRWREEILRGDPEKSMADHAIETSTLVISFITRGPADHPHGQGDEVLFFRARRKDPSPYQYQQDLRAPWSFLALEASPLVPIDSNEVIASAEELSRKSISGLIPHLDIDKDLHLVRRSKPLRWDNTTILESFLYRVNNDKEQMDSDAHKDLEERLGPPEFHYWTQLNGFQQGVESEIVSTAMIAVCFPPALSMGIDDIFADMNSRAEDLSQKALDVLYLCVQAGYARSGFRFYPIPPPPSGQPELEICAKRRVWAYWTQVAVWHLSRVRADAQVSISYTLLKALSAVKPSLDDGKVTIVDLEKLLVNAIATEADRSRNAARLLMREGVSEILYNKALAPDVAPGDDLLQKMHVITTSSSSIVYNVMAKLITQVLSRKPTSPGGGNNSANRQVMDLRITIAESRPLCEGVAVAIRLSQLVASFSEYRERAAKVNKRASGVPSVADLGPAALNSDIQARMRQMMMETESRGGFSALSPGKQAQTLGLAHLLADMDAKKEKKEPKVTIELITDAAVVSHVMASGASGVKPLILLSGDRILSNGDVVNKVGSAQMAWAGKLSGGAVLILSRADRVHSKDLPPPGKPSNAASELVETWKLTSGVEDVEQLLGAAHVTISNPLYEDISHGNVTGYITELGFMEHDMLCEFANIRSELERAIWG